MFFKKSLPWCPRLRNGRQFGPKCARNDDQNDHKSTSWSCWKPDLRKKVIFDDISDGSGPWKSLKVHSYRRFHGFRTARKYLKRSMPRCFILTTFWLFGAARPRKDDLKLGHVFFYNRALQIVVPVVPRALKASKSGPARVPKIDQKSTLGPQLWPPGPRPLPKRPKWTQNHQKHIGTSFEMTPTYISNSL